MRRVFEIDVLECPRCSRKCEVLAVITAPRVIRAFLACLGLATRAPPIAPARPAPQRALAYGSGFREFPQRLSVQFTRSPRTRAPAFRIRPALGFLLRVPAPQLALLAP
jgi:hypothetical protein